MCYKVEEACLYQCMALALIALATLTELLFPNRYIHSSGLSTSMLSRTLTSASPSACAIQVPSQRLLAIVVISSRLVICERGDRFSSGSCVVV